ncbi:cyclophilin-like protein [Eremomyces bilateralis CBS 781.70]|uniref:Cyclophilin-like protein n=1 Tax=Eremomyces bilateralis CBS 781.70 TaxID=1392243 RepID=A0A6G1G543_9PEZI|nr:cyclophilin-like protein [Eremomyces bilateralis CBS 781.70]KAF1813122.1 cyclophilin-like protein [Eremomyces bilateralis CBS 781.70]
MSTSYNLEPPPTAQVTLHTTTGDIDIELFGKQAPLATRNFLQHCLDGYYDGTIFHRLVPGFVIQGGDPTGTGTGGESSFEDGLPFADEFHTRLKFNRRGLVGMANSGGKDENASQFFITLGETMELTGKNTLFGRVIQNTIYTVTNMADMELVEGSERPLYPAKITGTKILINPFPDMVKRVREAPRVIDQDEGKRKGKRKKAKKALLSFGDEEDFDEVAPVSKKPKYNAKLISGSAAGIKVPVPEQQNMRKLERSASPPTKGHQRTTPSPPPRPRDTKLPARSKKSPSPSRSPSPSLSPSPEPSHRERGRRKSDVETTRAQIEALKASMKRSSPNREEAVEAPEEDPFKAMVPKTAIRGRKRRAGANGKDEERTLALLNRFKATLDAADPELEEVNEPAELGDKLKGMTDVSEEIHTNGMPTGSAEDEEDVCDLHFVAGCQSCASWETQLAAQEAKEAESDLGWMSHRLTFERDRLGKSLEWKRKNEEELVVIDPREKTEELKKAKKGGGRGGDWKERRDKTGDYRKR